MNRKFKTVDYTAILKEPVALSECVPEGHLARFVVEAIGQLDMSGFYARYGERGGEAIAPEILTGILIYGYASGVFSSRKLERATYESLPFRYVSGGLHPDHDTLANFRKTFGSEIQGLFVQVLVLAQIHGVLKFGNVSLDGTKIHADASKSKAVSYKRAVELEAQLKQEVAELMTLSERAESGEVARIMKNSRDGGFDQDYNAQIVVTHGSLLIVANTLSNHPNDSAEAIPALDAIPAELGKPAAAVLDCGFFTLATLIAMHERNIEPYIATGRDGHHQEWKTQPDAPPPDTASECVKMAYKLKTEIGQALYRLRKSTVEPVIGIIKEVLGFRQFSLRGLVAVANEWSLVCLAYNFKRLHTLLTLKFA